MIGELHIRFSSCEFNELVLPFFVAILYTRHTIIEMSYASFRCVFIMWPWFKITRQAFWGFFYVWSRTFSNSPHATLSKTNQPTWHMQSCSTLTCYIGNIKWKILTTCLILFLMGSKFPYITSTWRKLYIFLHFLPTISLKFFHYYAFLKRVSKDKSLAKLRLMGSLDDSITSWAVFYKEMIQEEAL